MTSLFDIPKIDSQQIRRGFPAPIPNTGWRGVTEFPMHFFNAAQIAYDVETQETDFSRGAGWAKGFGRIVGIAIAAKFHDGKIESHYFPIGHEAESHLNMNKDSVLAFVKDILETNIPKVGANLIYDYGWLTDYGIYPKGVQLDVQFAEALMSNDGRVNLEYLGTKYLNKGKETDHLYDWIRQTYPRTPNGKLRQHIWQSPVSLVGYYGEEDAAMPLRIIDKQWEILVANELTQVFLVECESIPLLVKMRRAGATVDIDRTLDLRDRLDPIIAQSFSDIRNIAGQSLDSLDSGAEIGRLCDSLKIKYPRTAEGNPSFKKEWLKAQTHPLFAAILQGREASKIQSTFIDGYILGGSVNGKIHCDFHPMRSESGGTRTGRYASSNPNLQNIPSRSKLGKELREIFIPDKGHQAMFCGDYSQIEYRTLAHFAVGGGADKVREQYRLDPTTDYHELTIKLVYELTGLKIERKYIKNINFGLLYGMSQAKLAVQLAISAAMSDEVFAGYHAGAPYVKATMTSVSEDADRDGYVRTILGRKGYFDTYVPTRGGYGEIALPFERAVAKWGYNISKDKLYKAINYKIQGSAADCMKMAMVSGVRSGIFDEVGVPRLTVHDELVFSVEERTPRYEEAMREYVHMAENCLPFSVPILFDSGYGTTWGNAKPD